METSAETPHVPQLIQCEGVEGMLVVAMYLFLCGYKTAKARSFSHRPISTTESVAAEYI